MVKNCNNQRLPLGPLLQKGILCYSTFYILHFTFYLIKLSFLILEAERYRLTNFYLRLTISNTIIIYL
jgi:hypothetical protein